MPSRDAWLAVFAAVLGVSEEACKREAKDAPAAVHDVPSASASAIVAATAPSASVEPAPSASAAPSASVVASASATPKKPDPDEQARQMLQNMQAICGVSIGTIGTGTGPGIGRINNSCGATPNRTVTSPTANVVVSGAGTIAGDDRTLAMMRPRVRSCANRGLNQNPDEQGKIVVHVAIAANGEVTSASVAQNNGLGEGTAQCIAHGIRSSTFPTSSGPRTILVTVVTQRQN